MAKAKAKGSKGSAKTAKPASKAAKKPAPKAAAKAKPKGAVKAKPAAKAAKPAAAKAPKAGGKAGKGAVKAPVAKAPKAVKASAAPVAKPEEVKGASVPPGADGGIPGGFVRPKKKVKRGAPPMLPRRMARRPPPPPGADGQPVAPPRITTSPGSLHAPARAPEGAEGLKARLMSVISDLARLRALRRTLQKNFWEAGLILAHLSSPELYQAKGYGSWESFLEREIERELTIGRTVAIDLVRIVRLFQRDPAEELGFERLRGAIKALWPEVGAQTNASAGAPGAGGGVT